MLEPPPATDGPQVVMPARRRLMWHDFTTGDSRFDDRTEKVRVPAAPEPPWNGTVQCCVHALYVDRNRHIGSLFMDICNGTDMYGCIGLFQSLDPGVRQIATWQSDGRRHNLEVVYRLNTDNEWEAIEPPAPVSRFGGVITPDNCRYLVPYPMVENATVSSWRETRPINYRNPWVFVVKDPRRRYAELTYGGDGSYHDWWLTDAQHQELLQAVRDGHAANPPRARAGSLLLGMGQGGGTAHLMTEDRAHKVMTLLVGMFRERIEARLRQPEEVD